MTGDTRRYQVKNEHGDRIGYWAVDQELIIEAFFEANVRIISAASAEDQYDLTNEDLTLLVDGSLGNFTINVFSASKSYNRPFQFKRIDGATTRVTIKPPDGETLDDDAFIDLQKWDVLNIRAYNGQWLVFGRP